MVPKQTVQIIQNMKASGLKIPMVTVYDYASSMIAERAGIPIFLVGDSLGMVMHGAHTTMSVTVDDMISHTRAVMRGAETALVVADLPFLSYSTVPDAVESVRRIVQESGVHAVKLEGGLAVAPIVTHLTKAGIPVMGHLGLTPQSQYQIGLRVQGKTVEAAQRLLDDALALERAGAFALVLELVPAGLAQRVTELLSIPVIGIGAGPHCDGQVQVWHDLLGLFDKRSPKHAKRFAEIGSSMMKALQDYSSDVQSGAFPEASQTVDVSPDILLALKTQI